MKKYWKWIVASVVAGIVVVAILSIWWVRYLTVAHSTFDNYYAFRGCTTLVERTDSYGVCKLKSGETIKIVKYQERWFLDGDLPCASGLCW